MKNLFCHTQLHTFMSRINNFSCFKIFLKSTTQTLSHIPVATTAILNLYIEKVYIKIKMERDTRTFYVLEEKKNLHLFHKLKIASNESIP